MTTLTGETNTHASKGAFFTSFVFQTGMIALILLIGAATVPTLNVQPISLAPVFLQPLHEVVQQQTPQNTGTQHTGGGPSIPASNTPRIFREFVMPRNVPTNIITDVAFNDLPPGVTDVVYGRNPGNGSGTGTGTGPNLIDVIGTNNATPPPPVAAPPVARITQGGEVQASKCIFRPDPPYPALAKNARISGTVILDAIIGRNGSIEQLSVRSGHPLLVTAAMDAVRKWRYSPTLLNKVPVEVQTTIEIKFHLSQ
jgi:TonB family protein